jgi:DNA-binding response OmpR family regulator
VLEDDAALRRLVSTLLERASYNVLAEETAAAAIATAEAHAGRIHLVLTDVVMPARSGPEVAAHLAVVRPEARLLYMSGDTGNMIGTRGLVPAGAALIEKPFTERSLLLKVRSLLDGAEPG